jgi:hypothetical protein
MVCGTESAKIFYNTLVELKLMVYIFFVSSYGKILSSSSSDFLKDEYLVFTRLSTLASTIRFKLVIKSRSKEIGLKQKLVAI